MNRVLFEGETISYTNAATDSDLPPNALTFSLQNPPAGATINPTNGVFTWTPDESQGPSTNQIVMIVSDDGTPSLTATQSFTVIVLETNSAPTLAGISNHTIFEGETLTFTNTASDTDLPANTLVFSLENAPTNAVIDGVTGVFSWTPNQSQAPATNTIAVIVTDNGIPSLTATQFFTVTVLKTNHAPVLVVVADKIVHAGSLVLLTNTATDSDLPANALTFSLDPGAPAGAGIASYRTTASEKVQKLPPGGEEGSTPLSPVQSLIMTSAKSSARNMLIRP